MSNVVHGLTIWRYLILCVVLLSTLPGFAHADTEPVHTTRVLFVNPTWPGHPHWQRITDTMRSAAHEFGIEVNVIYAGYEDRNKRLAYRDLVLSASRQKPRPDYVVFMFYKSVGTETLAALETAKIHSFTINTPIPDNERESIGYPQEHFKYWLGHIAPDDKLVGAQLAIDLLAQKSDNLLPDSRPIEGLGLTGDWLSSAAQDRKSGLQAIAKPEQIRIRQIVPASWDEEIARTKTRILLKRYPHVRYIWCASDTMALGAIAALKDMQMWQRGTFTIGGVDWTEEGLTAIADGELNASIGGHFLDGGWVMVMIYDHAHGVRLDKVKTRLTSPMKVLTRSNVASYRARLLDLSRASLQFSSFSLYKNARLEYQFDIDKAMFDGVK
jgi:ABC-type sugar transport system substrate-binding protein